MKHYYDYANKVLNGEIITGTSIKLACERFKADLQREDLTKSLHLDWEDGKAFEILFKKSIDYDREENRHKFHLSDILMYLRTVGIGMFPSEKFGFTLKPYVGTNPSGDVAWETSEQYNQEREYLKPFGPKLMAFLLETKEELAKAG